MAHKKHSDYIQSKERLSDVPELFQTEDGRWCSGIPYAVTVKGGRAAIYLSEDGVELKREPLARYNARQERAVVEFRKRDFTKKVSKAVECILQDVDADMTVKQRAEFKKKWCIKIEEALTEDI